MSTSPEVIAARKLNQVKYAVEDFDDGVKALIKVAIVFIILAVAMVLSVALGADNTGHIFFSLFGAIGLVLVQRIDFLPVAHLAGLTGAFFGLLALELSLHGLPDLLLPFLNANEWRGVPVFFNHLTPFVYWGVKILCGLYVLRLWVHRQKVFTQPEDLLEKVLRTRKA